MANIENLKKGKATQFKSGEEAVENGRKGGIASGKARREKRKLCETLAIIVGDEKVQENLSKALVNKALKGDTKAWALIRDSIGEKPKDKVEFEGHIPVVIVDDLGEED